MFAFTSDKEIQLTFAPTNDDGVAIAATAARYRIVGLAGELLAWTDVAGYAGGDVAIVVPAEINTLSSGQKIEARIIELEYATATGTVESSVDYVLESESMLEVDVNSFTSYVEAVTHAADVSGLLAWNEAAKRQRVAALRRAAVSIARLAFQLNQNNLTARDECAAVTRYIHNSPSSIFAIDQLSQSERAELPKAFKHALARAQVIEADNLLAGVSEEFEMRQAGVLSQSVGESKTFFRTVKPLTLPICRQAMQELLRYLYTTKRIGRG